MMGQLRSARVAARFYLTQHLRMPQERLPNSTMAVRRQAQVISGPQTLGFMLGLGLSVPNQDVFVTRASMESDTSKASQGSLAGTWIRDQAASDMEAYSRMLELLHLSGLQRTTALQLIEGLEVEQSENGATVRFLTVVPFFKVSEKLDFNKEVQQGRRDLRPGKQIARCKQLPRGLYVEMSWGEPMPGRLTETYHTDGSTLYVESSIAVQEGSATTVVVSSRLPCTAFFTASASTYKGTTLQVSHSGPSRCDSQ